MTDIKDVLTDIESKLRSSSSDGHTAGELREHLGIPRDRMRMILLKGVKEGRNNVSIAKRQSVTGAMSAVPVYKMVTAKGEK